MKRIDIKLYFTLFLIGFFAEVYFISQSSKDLFSIIGVGVVVLISTYLIVDSIQTQRELANQRLVNAINEQKNQEVHTSTSDQSEGNAEEGFKRLETVNKAVYVSLKKNLDHIKEDSESIKSGLKLIEEIHNDSTEETMDVQKQILDLNQKLYENQMKLYEYFKEYAESKGDETSL